MTRPISKDTEAALLRQDVMAIKGDIAALHQEVHELKAAKEHFYKLETEIALIRLGQTEEAKRQAKFEDGLAEKLSMLITKDQFGPVSRIVYGAAGAILTSFIMALVSLVYIVWKS